MNYNEMIEKWAEEQGIELNQEPNLDNLSEEDLNAYKTASEMMDEAIERIREAEEYYEACVNMQKEAEEDYAACEELYADVEKRASACEYIYNNIDEDALTDEFLSSEAGEELCDLLEKTASVAEGVQADRESIESYASELVDHYNYAEEVMKLAEEQYQEAMEALELAEKTAIEIEAKAMHGEDSEEKIAEMSDEEKLEKKNKVKKAMRNAGIALGSAALLGGLTAGGIAAKKHSDAKKADQLMRDISERRSNPLGQNTIDTDHIKSVAQDYKNYVKDAKREMHRNNIDNAKSNVKNAISNMKSRIDRRNDLYSKDPVPKGDEKWVL